MTNGVKSHKDKIERRGFAAIEEMGEEMREFGLSEEIVQKMAGPMVDALVRAGGSWRGVMDEIIESAPAMVEKYSRGRFRRH